MVKIEPLQPPQPPSKFDYLEYLEREFGYNSTLAETSPYFLEFFEKFQSEQLRKSIYGDYFSGDWRSGQEVHKVVITKRLYQISPESIQARFSKPNFIPKN